MTEKEKMLKGELYIVDELLEKEMLIAKDLCYEYNNLKPSNLEKRKEVIKKLLGKTGKEFFIIQPFWCDYGYNIEIGENFYANHNLLILDPNKVKIGNDVFIGQIVLYTQQDIQ